MKLHIEPAHSGAYFWDPQNHHDMVSRGRPTYSGGSHILLVATREGAEVAFWQYPGQTRHWSGSGEPGSQVSPRCRDQSIASLTRHGVAGSLNGR